MLRYVLLALLADGTPAHGYALMKAYRERSGVRLSIGNVYRELSRLAGEGLIVAATNPPGADPRRVPYRITDKGRDALATSGGAGPHTDGHFGRPAFPPSRDPGRPGRRQSRRISERASRRALGAEQGAGARTGGREPA